VEGTTVKEIDRLVPLCSPQNAGEEAVLRSLLRSEGVEFFVFNDFFGSMKVGPVIPLYNQKFILVARQDLDRSRELLAARVEEDGPVREPRLSTGDKLRMLLEVLIFHWIIPGSGRRGRWREDGT
jgi:hypothetical protein